MVIEIRRRRKCMNMHWISCNKYTSIWIQSDIYIYTESKFEIIPDACTKCLTSIFDNAIYGLDKFKNAIKRIDRKNTI